MLRKLLAGSAIAALVASGAMAQSAPSDTDQWREMIFAQAATDAQENPQLDTDGKSGSDAEPSPGADKSAQQQQIQGSAATEEQKAAAEAMKNTELEDVIFLSQSQSQIRANDYIGETVFNAEGDALGEVSDVLFDRDGGVAAALIGAGGFLGMGVKEVGVSFDSIEIRNQDNGSVYLVFDTTKEALEAAPEFLDLEQQRIAENMRNKNDPATTSSVPPNVEKTSQQ